MRKTLILALAAPLFAGGFFLQLGNPDASPEARKANAVVVIKATGCHNPANAQVTAVAIGAEKRIPLNLTRLSEPGTFALAQQWPKEGKWVIEITGHNGEQFTNTLIPAGPNGLDRLHAKFAMTAFARSEIDSLLE